MTLMSCCIESYHGPNQNAKGKRKKIKKPNVKLFVGVSQMIFTMVMTLIGSSKGDLKFHIE